jgi:hypothetical protein
MSYLSYTGAGQVLDKGRDEVEITMSRGYTIKKREKRAAINEISLNYAGTVG